jgi:propanol-preferring alcohol dehydrogenase
VPGCEQILIKVAACDVCRTDLHVFDGELIHPKLPLSAGSRDRRARGNFGRQCRVGVPWLGFH